MSLFIKIITLLYLTVPLYCFSQQKRKVFFDELWQVSSSKQSQYYICECAVLDNGAYDGPFTCFTIGTDAKVKVYNFSNNVLDGEIKEFYEDGSTKLHAFYNMGLPIQTWKEWDRDGNLVVDKTFDENSIILKDKKKLTDYEKMYFGEKDFEAPVFMTECILKQNEKEKYICSDEAMLAYYKHPPLPPSYLSNANFIGKTIVVQLKYELSEDGKVINTKIIESSNDAFLDELAEIHLLNMIPFEAAKRFENPINYWIDAEVIFDFSE